MIAWILKARSRLFDSKGPCHSKKLLLFAKCCFWMSWNPQLTRPADVSYWRYWNMNVVVLREPSSAALLPLFHGSGPSLTCPSSFVTSSCCCYCWSLEWQEGLTKDSKVKQFQQQIFAATLQRSSGCPAPVPPVVRRCFAAGWVVVIYL